MNKFDTIEGLRPRMHRLAGRGVCVCVQVCVLSFLWSTCTRFDSKRWWLVVTFFRCVTYDKIDLKSGYCDGGNARRSEGDAAGQADGENVLGTRCGDRVGGERECGGEGVSVWQHATEFEKHGRHGACTTMEHRVSSFYSRHAHALWKQSGGTHDSAGIAGLIL